MILAMQSYHNNHIEGPNPPNGVHGHINTRSELRNYDPGVYRLIKELYPCGNTYHWCKGKILCMHLNSFFTTKNRKHHFFQKEFCQISSGHNSP